MEQEKRKLKYFGCDNNVVNKLRILVILTSYKECKYNEEINNRNFNKILRDCGSFPSFIYTVYCMSIRGAEMRFLRASPGCEGNDYIRNQSIRREFNIQ
jgi:hypothetical protein